MKLNRQLVLAGRRILCDALRIERPCPDDFIGSLATVPLPDAPEQQAPLSPLYADPLQDRLLSEYAIEVPVIPWPAPPQRLLRISAQLYNSLPQYERLAGVLNNLLAKEAADRSYPKRI
jgi:isopenicillin-N epimerase